MQNTLVKVPVLFGGWLTLTFKAKSNLNKIQADFF